MARTPSSLTTTTLCSKNNNTPHPQAKGSLRMLASQHLPRRSLVQRPLGRDNARARSPLCRAACALLEPAVLQTVAPAPLQAVLAQTVLQSTPAFAATPPGIASGFCRLPPATCCARNVLLLEGSQGSEPGWIVCALRHRHRPAPRLRRRTGLPARRSRPGPRRRRPANPCSSARRQGRRTSAFCRPRSRALPSLRHPASIRSFASEAPGMAPLNRQKGQPHVEETPRLPSAARLHRRPGAGTTTIALPRRGKGATIGMTARMPVVRKLGRETSPAMGGM